MKIAVNARHLCEPHVGIGQYLRRLLEGMEQEDLEIVLLSPVAVSDVEVKALLNKKSPQFSLEVIPEKKGLGKQYWEQFQIGAFANSISADVLWSSYPCLIRNFKGKIVQTVHDLIPWKLREYRKGWKSSLAASFAKRGIKTADRIVTVSETMRHDLAQFFKKETADISVTPNSVADCFKETYDSHMIESIKEKYGLISPYYIYVGGYDKRKCVASLLQSFEGARSAHDQIALAGQVSRTTELYVNPIDLSYDKSFVMPTGFVSDRELAILLHGAVALVHGSVMEGFNIPLLQAQNCGCPIIARDLAVNAEIAPSALLGDVGDSAWLKTAMKQIEDEKDMRVAKGRHHAKNYSHTHSAFNLLQALDFSGSVR